MKQAFYRVGNHIINQYEVRRVELLKGKPCPDGCIAIPRATIYFKDGTKITVASTQVSLFVKGLMEF